MTEPRLIKDMPINRRDDLIAQVWAFLTDRGYTITAPGLAADTRLRERIAYLARVYAVAPGEPRCCSDCAANDISDELRSLLSDVQ